MRSLLSSIEKGIGEELGKGVKGEYDENTLRENFKEQIQFYFKTVWDWVLMFLESRAQELSQFKSK